MCYWRITKETELILIHGGGIESTRLHWRWLKWFLVVSNISYTINAIESSRLLPLLQRILWYLILQNIIAAAIILRLCLYAWQCQILIAIVILLVLNLLVVRLVTFRTWRIVTTVRLIVSSHRTQSIKWKSSSLIISRRHVVLINLVIVIVLCLL